MKLYIVLFENDYAMKDVHSDVCPFTTKKAAIRCLEKAITDEIRDGRYTDEEVVEKLVRDGDDYFCFYYDSIHCDLKFRGTIYEKEIN